MEKESKNGLDLIRISADKLKGSWGRVFLATLIYVAPLVLFCLIPYAGWAISVALFGYLTIGYINFMQQTLKGEKPSFKVLYVQPEYMPAIMVGIIIAIGTMLGLLLFIVPGILVIGYYSMSLFVLNEEKIVNVTDTLNVAARQMNGNKTALFAYKVVYYLFYVLVGAVSAVCEMFISGLYTSNLALGVVLTILLVLVSIVLFTIITMYFYASNCVFYEEVVRKAEVTDCQLKSEKNVIKMEDVAKVEETNTEAKVEEKVEEPVVEEEKVEETAKTEEKVEKPVKKTPAKKTTAKKSTTTTAKKTTAKKTTAEKKE